MVSGYAYIWFDAMVDPDNDPQVNIIPHTLNNPDVIAAKEKQAWLAAGFTDEQITIGMTCPNDFVNGMFIDIYIDNSLQRRFVLVQRDLPYDPAILGNLYTVDFDYIAEYEKTKEEHIKDTAWANRAS